MRSGRVPSPLLTQAAAENRLWALESQLRTQIPQVQVVLRRDQEGNERAVALLGGIDPQEQSAL